MSIDEKRGYFCATIENVYRNHKRLYGRSIIILESGWELNTFDADKTIYEKK